MSRCKVEMTTESELQLKADFRLGKISSDDIKVIKRWVFEVESEGIEHAQKNVTWRDHELSGKWKNHRAISFSFSGRVIYKIEDDKIIIRVVRVTAQHDYK